ncbi:hypothetical protein LJC07_03390 [Christensenellaceae bacterium OttesenSCG-928-L17]|nr:hypothetical protein [Christensenellaceae bacterium OttesenSCG-928-L17]
MEDYRYVPELEGTLRSHMIKVPEIINQATGISIFGKLIKSLAFTTDVAIIKNINANAIIAVYPFTPQPAITHALMTVADVPVFCGVGGGITGGKRTLNIAQDAEFQGAMGVVVNAPTPNETIEGLKRVVDIPVVVTVVSEHTDIKARLDAGADIFNVSGGLNTAAIVRTIRDQYPYVPIIATGGVSVDSIALTIDAGANAITYTPPAQATLLRTLMEKYRSQWDD